MNSSSSWTSDKYIETVREVLRRSTQDKAFRQQALADADKTLESVSGIAIPADKRGKAKFVEQAGGKGHVLPAFGAKFEPDQLSDAELERVAGGGSPWCWFTSGCYCFFTK
ncbi:MAG TPA: hypothetical protein VEA63_05795 [Opitutus sp.]|jgi:hypothetical protein|nr:hypothetical protein [Opitutus sp.]